MELSTSEDLSGATCPFSTTIQSSLGLVCEYCNRYGCVNVNGGRKGERDKRGGGEGGPFSTTIQSSPGLVWEYCRYGNRYECVM